MSNQEYKDYFIDTVVNRYPAPAIVVYQEITPDGISKISIVNEFPFSEDATIQNLQGKYFKELEPDVKQSFCKYQFAIEYMPSSDEKIIGHIFDKIISP
ncbi:hypothetical protein [Crocosphaera subtropica]|nr:hypothetical protein [Crocosphaera subtropica]